MRTVLTLAFVSSFVSLAAACREPAPPRKDVLYPVCRTAEAMSAGMRLNAATDDATKQFAVKVHGPGEIAYAGFLHPHEVTVVDLGTGTVAAHTKTEVCKVGYLPLPTEAGGYGEYCVILEPLEKKQWSTFDLDYTKEQHPRDSAAMDAKLCGDQH